MFTLVNKINKRNFLVQTVIFLVLTAVMFSPLLVLGAGHTTGEADLVDCDGPKNPSKPGGKECNFAAFTTMINKLITFLIQIAAVFAACMFAWAGWLMLSSQGNEGKITEAKKIIYQTIVGFLIILLAWLIVNVLLGTLLRDNNENNEAETTLKKIFGSFTKL